VIAWPAGETSEPNLASECDRDHRFKHEGHWRHQPSTNPEHPPGTIVMISPTGHVYLSHPHSYTDPPINPPPNDPPPINPPLKDPTGRGNSHRRPDPPGTSGPSGDDAAPASSGSPGQQIPPARPEKFSVLGWGQPNPLDDDSGPPPF
jgi:hypothetical protein